MEWIYVNMNPIHNLQHTLVVIKQMINIIYQVLVYDIEKLKIIYSFSVFNKRVNYVRFLDSDTIIAADGEGKIAIFNNS